NRATAPPALSIRDSEAMPCSAVVAASAARISAAVRIFIADVRCRFTMQMITASAREAVTLIGLQSLLNDASSRGGLAKRARGRSVRRVLLRKVAVVPQIAVEDAGQFRCLRAKGGASSFEEEDSYDAA